MTGWTVGCPAKVNLFLRILAREDSGYHQIETLFQAVDLQDRVDVRPGAGGISLEVRPDKSPPARGSVAPNTIGDLGAPDENTVMRAARAFFAATGIAPAVSLVLTKSIPAGTGLGGASSDAAGTLAALNAMHDTPLTTRDLIALGGRIGADIPFFCSGAATALAWGRGDRLLRCPSPPARPVVLVIPRERVSTATAYRETSAGLQLPAPPSLLARPSLLAEAGSEAWRPLAALQWNDFERAVFARVAGLAEVRAMLAEAGASIARLTGSGAAVFGGFRDARGARAAAAAAGTMEGVAAALVVPTLTEVPGPEPEPEPMQEPVG
ncbi:MAG: 4-(cytidine 5'-diphospho)-2-C-methyl-D-erythritol kinase [Gemmatimonadetes bacterium]|nr:4-(cytidine 5'-diphospho)-2-C-methyl-D-erythritol kinase [Gemmatimonadota bacterium]